MPKEFKLPSLGENIESGDVVKVLVSAGDRIEQHQSILELETDKAVIEVPSTVSGTVKKIHVKEGDKAEVGSLILTVEEDGAGAAEEKEEAQEEVKAKEAQEKKAREKAPAAEAAEAKEEEEEEKEEARPREELRKREPQRARGGAIIDFRPTREETPAGDLVPAAPSVRRFARELGVDIHQVRGTGAKGRISIDDVKSHVREGRAVTGALPVEALPDFERWGEVERRQFSSVRRKTAQHLSAAWVSVPHVTQYDKADVTDLEEARKRYAKRVEAAGGKLTITAILLKVTAAALKVFPQFNASIDMARQEVIYKKYMNVGVAVDTERGLLVPVVRDADQKNIVNLSIELSGMAEKARKGKLTLEEMQGGCFTITNLGGIGGTYFSPIVNSPEVAILGVSRGVMEPVYREDGFEPRLMLPLSLSYDHRLIDGADAIRFLRWVVQALEDPFLLSLEG